MTSKTLLSFFVLIFFALTLQTYSQTSSLYIPRNIQKAFEKGTRSYDGKPGPNYWQNGSDYKIHAEVNPITSILSGVETITYHNNSPDTLKRIVVRLYQNVMKPGSVRDWPFNPDAFTDGVKLDYFLINGDTINVSPKSKEVRVSSTNMFVKLKNPLAPGDSLKINAKWSFEISEKVPIRMGNYKDGDFFVAYWYPQMSVYDDIDGWDILNYQGNVEFYNDFSNYDVSITVPNGYTIWAAGELQNGSQVLKEDIYKRYLQAKQSDETIHIITAEDRKNNNVTADNEKNTWHFVAKDVTDFTFALSKSFVWDGAGIEVDKKTGRRVLTDVVYKDSTMFWDTGAQIERTTINYLSNVLPGYPYPYPHITSFCNKGRGGGMESPMMTNDGAPTNKARFIGLLFHEIAHSYFPFIMGINERKYAWMDEGWASFFPQETVDSLVPGYDYLKRNVHGYESTAGMESELPPMVVSYSNKSRYMRTAFYSRPSNAYRELELLLGRKLFKKALLDYITNWHGHHPIPYDFFFTFNRVTGEDLSWFWKPWFFEFGYPDLGIENVTVKNDTIEVKIKKIGNIPTRVEVTFIFNDGTQGKTELSSRIWKNSTGTILVKYKTDKKLSKVLLGNKHIPDSNRKNNEFIVK
ncbi:hypothetical protein BMS3Abin04_01989 [bacterium BMS3Abin04]|nr:hypothetical protein BMS3Abin04_01989 [bacterium BMS3Abin04]